MSSLLEKYTDKANFWKIYTNYKLFEPFKDLYIKDHSKGKKESSKIMWGVLHLIDDSNHNPLASLPMDEKKEIVNSDMFDNKLNWEEYEGFITKFRNMLYTKVKRDLIEWEDKLEERRKFIRDTPYTLDSTEVDIQGKVRTIKGTATQLDNMAANTNKIYELMDKLELKVQAERDGIGEVKGGRRESASELGKI